MDINTVGALIYSIVTLVVAIISATIMRAKQYYCVKFDIGDAFLCLFLGVVWPITVVVGVVYLTSDFLYSKFFKE